MSNETPPQEIDDVDSAQNPFDNPEITERTHDVDDRHLTDDPGRDYDNESEVMRKISSSPSEPRRPGAGGRQAPRRGNDDSIDAGDPVVPGEILLHDDPIQVNDGLEVTTLRVANRADRPIQIGSHFHFAEVNPALDFDREAAWGKHLNVLSGGAVRFEPGADEEIQLVPFQGDRIALGFRGECGGKLDA